MPPSPLLPKLSELHTCEIAMSSPTIFDAFSDLYKIFPLIFLFILIVVILFKKQKMAFLQRLFTRPVFIIFLLMYILFYPRIYIQLNRDYKEIKRCSCFGIKSEVFGGNSDCYMRKQDCLGLPYSCQQIPE